MKKQERILGILLCLFLTSGILLFSRVDDTEAATVRILKPKIRVRLSPGGSESGSISVTNPSDEAIQVNAYLEDWVYTDVQDGSKDFALPGTTPLSCAKWISFYPAEFTLEAFGSQEVYYVIKAPEKIEGGGRYAVLFFETVVGTTKDAEGVNVLIKGRIGSLFYVEVEPIKKEVELKNLSLKKEGQNLNISAVLHNIGNVDVTASGSFDIIDSRGMVFARGKFNEVYTFPDEKAVISSAWSDAIPSGNYDLILTLDLGDVPLVKEARISIDSYGGVIHVSPEQ